MSILVYIRTYVYGVFKISYYGFGPTEVRVIIILLNTIIYFFGAYEFLIENEVYTLLDFAALFLAIAFLIIFVVSVIIEGRKLKAEELKNQQK